MTLGLLSSQRPAPCGSQPNLLLLYRIPRFETLQNRGHPVELLLSEADILQFFFLAEMAPEVLEYSKQWPDELVCLRRDG